MRNYLIKISATAVMFFALSGCSGSNSSNGPTVDKNGKHPANWIKTHKNDASASTASCTGCHGSDLTGGISKVSCMSSDAISGFQCHASSPAANLAGCKSCHGTPPDGTTAPNRANAHATHLALANVTCVTCHSGAGFGTASHAKATATGGIADATVSSLPASFQAKTVTTFGYDAASKTCSGIICHGGLKTPSWSSSVAIRCVDCHALGSSSQNPQFNSYYSGRISVNSGLNLVNLHQIHLLEKVPGTSTLVACTDCHNSNVLAVNHFTGLTTPAFEATAASTISGGNTKITSYTPYTALVPSGSCASTCHAQRYWVSP